MDERFKQRKELPMPRDKKIFLSDIHMGAGRDVPAGRYPYDWLNQSEADNLAAFLDHIINKPPYSQEVAEVILLGDIFDNWICPTDEVPPTFQEIIDAEINKGIIKGLKALAGHDAMKLTYLPGNHDMGVDKNFLLKNFPGINFREFAKGPFTDGKLSAEHGHAYGMFNAPDPWNEPVSSLPLGYYISRVVAYKAATQGGETKSPCEYIEYVFHSKGHVKLPELVFDCVLQDAKLTDDADIIMPPVNGQTFSIKAGEVKQKYAALFDQWVSKHDIGYALEAVLADDGFLWKTADKLLMSGSNNIIIFGHSHDRLLEGKPDPVSQKDKINANSGAWCGQEEGKLFTFVETDKEEMTGEHIVRLKSWKDGQVTLIKDGSVEL